MSDRTSSPGFSDLSDPNDPFYADPYDSDSSDTLVEADFVTHSTVPWSMRWTNPMRET